MSIKYMSWAWEQPLAPVKKLILLKLADNANDAGGAFPSVKSIAKYCSISQRTVQRILQNLSDEGLIRIEKRFRYDGSQSSNHYSLRPALLGSDNLSFPPVSGDDESSEVPPQGCPDYVTPITSSNSSVNQQLPESDFGWIFPEIFSEEDKLSAAGQLKFLQPEQVQLVLDELAGRIRVSEIREPLSYLCRLISKMRSGTFIPELAKKEQEKRNLALAHKAHEKIYAVSKEPIIANLPKLPKPMQESMLRLREKIVNKK